MIHYETVAVPPGHKSVWVKYLMNTTEPTPAGCSIYALRIEANYAPADAGFKPMDVTFTWSEPQKDRGLVQRSHRQLVTKIPTTYTINVGGEDQPVVKSLEIAAPGEGRRDVKYGYSDGQDVGGEKFMGKWVTYGRNLAAGKSYTCSAVSLTNWGAGDPDGKKLTDGVAGPPCAGGASYKWGAIYKEGANPVFKLDLGQVQTCAAFGMNIHGYPWWDALKGEVKDKVEVLVSDDGQNYTSIGFLNTDLRWKDLPVNHMWPDDETITGATFRLIPPAPVKTRYVQYKLTSGRLCCVTEVEVLDSIKFEPFDLKIALPQ